MQPLKVLDRYMHSVRKIETNLSAFVLVGEQGAKFKITSLLGF